MTTYLAIIFHIFIKKEKEIFVLALSRNILSGWYSDLYNNQIFQAFWRGVRQKKAYKERKQYLEENTNSTLKVSYIIYIKYYLTVIDIFV
jgi:hypothetical protein